MPEGDTVYRTAARLHGVLAGDVLTSTDFRVPRFATADLSGRTVTEVVSRGKHLLTRMTGGLTLHSHLRMEGAWRVYAPGERWRGGPGFQIRVVLSTERVHAVGYRLPIVELIRTSAEPGVVGHLGPDLLGADWDPAEAVRRLLATPGRELGAALLDQRNLAGIGTVYLAEVCFLAGESPYTPVERVANLEQLVVRAHTLMARNAQTGQQVTTGDPRPGRQHWVYGRAPRPCRRCGTPVRVGEIGRAPQERVAFWCPTCQPSR